jgi:predicted RNase H-like nuclease (RuvC/YqgF family)
MKSARLPLIVLSILCVIFLLVAVQQFLGGQKEKNSRVLTEKILEETKQAKDKIRTELDEQNKLKAELESQVTDLKDKLVSLQDQAETFASQLAEEKKAKEDAVVKLNDKIKEVESIKSNFENADKERLSLQEQYDKVSRDYESLQEELRTIRAQNDGLSKQLGDLEAKKEVELDKIVVRPGSEAEGKVLVVNKEFNFIVVSAGNNKGLTPGVVISIFRDGNFVAKAQVEKVYETMSAANIMPDGADIKEGDIAKAM